ncbi:R3H domain containing-like [Scophthalmus maximus]|nr:R3H domain containing-like [Scophthalmus maximus]XP_035501925.1 R3H domain containing-like [Scophthalmus maximus]
MEGDRSAQGGTCASQSLLAHSLKTSLPHTTDRLVCKRLVLERGGLLCSSAARLSDLGKEPPMKSPAGTQRRCLLLLVHRAQMGAACVPLLLAATLWTMPHAGAAAAELPSSTELLNAAGAGAGARSDLRMPTAAAGVSRSRRRRAISSREMNALLDYHNRVRSQVFPPAANMEYMLWDEGLAKSADSWASLCIWDHGPTQAMKYMGQNLAITSARHQSVTDLVRSWYDERHQFSYPNRCSGSVCSHYTQMVWASTSRVGCAVRKCSNVHVFGSNWREATLLVCNYSIKGNWLGEAPYKTGRPCSDCPSSYGGSCWRNQCSPNAETRRLSKY